MKFMLFWSVENLNWMNDVLKVWNFCLLQKCFFPIRVNQTWQSQAEHCFEVLEKNTDWAGKFRKGWEIFMKLSKSMLHERNSEEHVSRL